MQFHRFILSVVLMSLSTVAFAQSTQSFDKLKTLAGSWEGHMTTVPPHAEIEGKLMQVTLRVTSMGNALMHEMTGPGRPDDPITMLYLDGDRLMLTHYCDAGNRPRMTGTMSPDSKSVEFEFLDVAGQDGQAHFLQDEPVRAAVYPAPGRRARSVRRVTSRSTHLELQRKIDGSDLVGTI
jgi:hypothetical protein